MECADLQTPPAIRPTSSRFPLDALDFGAGPNRPVDEVARYLFQTKKEIMRRFRYVALIGISVLAALVNVLPAHAGLSMNHSDTFLRY
jgi:hypothetical protein